MSTLHKAAQQALEALKKLVVGSDYEEAVEAEQAMDALRAALAQQAEPVEPLHEQDIEDAIEAAYWHFDARKKGLNEWASAPQSERDAFKAEARKLAKGYFPTQQAQDTKREMLAVADAFIRGKRAALAQEQAEPEGGGRLPPPLQAEPVQEPNLSHCPQCNGPADNGHDRSIPPHPYFCTRCMAEPPQRKPLTEKEIQDCFHAARNAKLGASKDNSKHRLSVVEIARAIERAHGIIESEIREDIHQTLDDAMQQPRAMAQAYENGYKAGAAAKDAEHQQTLALQQRSYEREIEIEVEAEREECAKLAEATICDTHLPTGVRIYGTRVAESIRARSNT